MNDKQRMARNEMRRRAEQNFNEKHYGKEQDVKEKRSLALFFDIFFKNIGSFFWMNLLYMLAVAPVIICVFFLSRLLNGTDMTAEDFQWLPTFIYVPILFGVLLGPVTAALTYLERKLLTQKHIFFWSDFAEQFKKNFKQSWFFGILDTLCIMSVGSLSPMLINVFKAEQIPMKLVWIMGGFFLVVFVYFSMRPYLYLQVVTVKLTVGQMARNAFFFVVLAVKNNIISFLIFITVIIVTLAAIPWSLILCATVELSLVWFVCIWFAYKKFYELLIAPELERIEQERKLNPGAESDELDELDDLYE